MHFIVTQQIGFTTIPPHSRHRPALRMCGEDRSPRDLHVKRRRSGAVVFAATVAIESGRRSSTSVVIDMFCFAGARSQRKGRRSRVHQPGCTRGSRPIRPRWEIYSKRLISRGVMTRSEVEKAGDWRVRLDDEIESRLRLQPTGGTARRKEAGFKSADAEKTRAAGVPSVDVAVQG